MKVVHKLFDHLSTLCGLNPAKLGPERCTQEWEEVTCRRCTYSTFAPNMIHLGYGRAMQERQGG